MQVVSNQILETHSTVPNKCYLLVLKTAPENKNFDGWAIEYSDNWWAVLIKLIKLYWSLFEEESIVSDCSLSSLFQHFILKYNKSFTDVFICSDMEIQEPD